MSVLIQAHRAGQILQAAGVWHHRWHRVFIKHGVAREESLLKKWAHLLSQNPGRQETEGIVFSCDLLSQVTYSFSPYPSYSPNSGHKNCSEFCLVASGEVYWMSEFIKSSFWLFSLLSNGLSVGCRIHFSRVSLSNSQFAWFLQVVMKSLPLSLFSQHPLWS